MQTRFITKLKAMKNVKLLLLALVSCWGYYAHAQLTCGINANYQVSVNPNGVPVFYDSTYYSPGFQPVSYLWDFGDGSTSTQQNPSHNFTGGPGPYNVCLYVTAQLQGSTVFCTDTFCNTYTNCNNMVVATAQAQPQSGGIIVYTASGSSNYPPLAFSWTFPGGSPPNSTTAVTTVQYQNNGTYQGCVTVTDANGCAATNCASATVTSAPCTNVNASFNVQSFVNYVTLTSTSTGVTGSTNYQWFMDGTAISSINPNTSYTYTLPNGGGGNHTFCLKVFSSNSSTTPCSDTCKTIFVYGNGPCGGAQANFTSSVSGNNVSVNAGTNYASGTLYQWWIDGQSTTPAPTATQYSWQNLSVGTHQVCLYIYNAQQQFCDSICQYISTGNACAANADFTTTPGSAPGSITFVGVTNPSGAVYTWNFGDGSTFTSTNIPQVLHQYTVTSTTLTYIACLTVSIPGTTCVDSFCTAVVVPGSTSGCQAYFTFQTTPTGNMVYFTNQSNTGGASATYAWSFSDGSTSNQANPVVNFGSPGLYQACLTVSTNNGCTSTYCDTINVGNGGCQLSAIITAFGSTLMADVTGGTGPYTYIWNTNANTQSIIATTPGTYCVTVYDANQCMGTSCYTLTQAGTDTICGTIFNDLNGNGVMDGNETAVPGAVVYIGNYTAVSDSDGYYTAVVPAGTYTIYYCAGSGYSYTLPVSPNSNALNSCAYYQQVVITGGGSHCGFNFGVQNNSVSICGKVFFDANNNGTQDANTEAGIQGGHVYVVSSNNITYHAYTNANGEYCVTVPAGTYTINVTTSNTSVACTTTPATLSVTGTAGQSLSNQNFAVYCQPGVCDLKITVYPNTTVTTGFPAWYQMQVTNVGTSVSSGTANFFYDPALVFDYASPVQSSHNASTRTVSFNITNLLPGQSKYYMVRFNALTTLTIGQFVFTLTNINPDVNCNDVNLTNNVDTIHQAVTASWDPNNKLAYTTNYDPNPAYQLISSVEPNQRIEYVINFQNTGTSPAVNVVVEDLISADLDFSSFEFLGSSHPCVVTSAAGKVNFKFSDIMLPDSINDEPNSHGFVRFAINAVNGLQGGHVISDDAAIYFDFNAPVITNDAAVTLLEPNGIDDITANTVVVAPNPMKDYAEIMVRGNNNTFNFRVTDVTGRVVSELVGENGKLIFNRSNLSAGIYVYNVLQNNRPIAKGKLVIE